MSGASGRGRWRRITHYWRPWEARMCAHWRRRGEGESLLHRRRAFLAPRESKAARCSSAGAQGCAKLVALPAAAGGRALASSAGGRSRSARRLSHCRRVLRAPGQKPVPRHSSVSGPSEESRGHGFERYSRGLVADCPPGGSSVCLCSVACKRGRFAEGQKYHYGTKAGDKRIAPSVTLQGVRRIALGSRGS